MKSQREKDLRKLGALLDDHAEELNSVESEAFAGMRFWLTAYEGVRPGQQHLSDKQRTWLNDVYERVVPEYSNLSSSGGLAKGDPTPESRALDKMLSGPKPLRPPSRKISDDDE